MLDFKIAAAPLDAVLTEYRRTTGLKVVLTEPLIETVQSPGASGSLTPARAMDALLAGTGVRATFTSDEVRLSLQGVRETLAVTGEAAKLESPKYTEALLDTPQTVVVIPQQIFLEQNASSLRDVLRNTPGITMSIGEGGSGGTSSGDNVLIRGFSARNDIFIDGARDPGLAARCLRSGGRRGRQRPCLGDWWPRHHGRLYQSRDESTGTPESGNFTVHGRKRRQQANGPRCESQADRYRRVPRERHVAGHGLSRTGRGTLPKLGRCTLAHFGPGQTHDGDLECFAFAGEQHPRLGFAHAAS
jgi:hypothetical protein